MPRGSFCMALATFFGSFSNESAIWAIAAKVLLTPVTAFWFRRSSCFVNLA